MKPRPRSEWMEGLLLAEQLMRDSTPNQVSQYIIVECSHETQEFQSGMYDYLRNYRSLGERFGSHRVDP